MLKTKLRLVSIRNNSSNYLSIHIDIGRISKIFKRRETLALLTDRK